MTLAPMTPRRQRLQRLMLQISRRLMSILNTSQVNARSTTSIIQT